MFGALYARILSNRAEYKNIMFNIEQAADNGEYHYDLFPDKKLKEATIKKLKRNGFKVNFNNCSYKISWDKESKNKNVKSKAFKENI